MRIVFMGTPEFSVPVLTAVAAAGHDIVAVYTRAPKPAGRGKQVTRSPVHDAAERAGIPVLHPASLRSLEAAAAFRAHGADVAVVVAYGLILPRSILDAPAHGCLNLHGSLLPRWRGAAPIQRAIMAGDAETGVEIMRMEEGLDTGPVAGVARLPLAPETTAGEAQASLAALGADLMVQALTKLARGDLRFTPQPSAGVTYAHKIDKAECRIDWTRDATAVRNHMHGLSPAPGAFFEADLGRGPERIRVLRVAAVDGAGLPGTVIDDALTIACGVGAVRLLSIQRGGKAPMAAAEFLRGTRITVGANLG